MPNEAGKYSTSTSWAAWATAAVSDECPLFTDVWTARSTAVLVNDR
jgi:hypothetical protein